MCSTYYTYFKAAFLLTICVHTTTLSSDVKAFFSATTNPLHLIEI